MNIGKRQLALIAFLKKMFRIPFDMFYEKIESDYVDDIKVRMSVAYQNRNFQKNSCLQSCISIYSWL